MSYKEIFPPVETVLEMEPEELASFVLKYLSLTGTQKLNKHNFSLGTDPEFREWAEKQGDNVLQQFMLAWMWLERELFIAPQPGNIDWYFITKRGEKILEGQNFETYRKSHLLPSDNLDPILVRKVKPSFIRGDYDAAVFQAFKEVEIRVRDKAGFTNREIGVDLMRKAFGPPKGPLVDTTAHPAEQAARMEIFSGTIGMYKNPSSHRDIEFSDPNEVADIIHIANALLRIVDSINT